MENGKINALILLSVIFKKLQIEISSLQRMPMFLTSHLQGNDLTALERRIV